MQRYADAKTELTHARVDLVRTLGPEHPRVHTLDERMAELERDPATARAHVLKVAH